MKKALGALSFLLPSFVLLILPGSALAAGFAKDSLFLSKSPITEGETVKIYTIVANTAATAFKGSVVLSDGAQKIASIDVSMDAGGTQTASAPWKPLAGTHTLKAELTASDGDVVETESTVVSIAAPTPPPTAFNASSQSAASIDSSADIQKTIAGVSPQVANVAEPMFTVIDGARNSVADTLDSQIASTKTKLANTQKPGVVLGASTGPFSDPKLTNPWGMFWYALYTAYLYILIILRWLVGSAGIFYPFLAIIFLYILWRAYRRIRRPSYN